VFVVLYWYKCSWLWFQHSTGYAVNVKVKNLTPQQIITNAWFSMKN